MAKRLYWETLNPNQQQYWCTESVCLITHGTQIIIPPYMFIWFTTPSLCDTHFTNPARLLNINWLDHSSATLVQSGQLPHYTRWSNLIHPIYLLCTVVHKLFRHFSFICSINQLVVSPQCGFWIMNIRTLPPTCIFVVNEMGNIELGSGLQNTKLQ